MFLYYFPRHVSIHFHKIDGWKAADIPHEAMGMDCTTTKGIRMVWRQEQQEIIFNWMDVQFIKWVKIITTINRSIITFRFIFAYFSIKILIQFSFLHKYVNLSIYGPSYQLIFPHLISMLDRPKLDINFKFSLTQVCAYNKWTHLQPSQK